VQFVHFGHFLTETVSWLAAFEDPALRLFLKQGVGPKILLGKYAASGRDTLAAYLSLPPEQILCTEDLEGPTHIERVILPVRTMVNRSYIMPRHLEALKRLVDVFYVFPEAQQHLSRSGNHQGKYGGKVYLSRSLLSPEDRHIRGEEQIESLLSANEWQNVYPERLTVTDQIEILRNAKAISGNTGSAFHLLMYLGASVPPKCVITLGSRSEILENSSPNNVFAHCRLQGMELYHLAAFAEPCRYIKPQGAALRQWDLEILHPPEKVAQAIETIASGFLTRRHGRPSRPDRDG